MDDFTPDTVMDAQNLACATPHQPLSENANYRMLADVPVRLCVEVGAASMRLREILELTHGNVVELDRDADDLLDIKVNGTLIARGEIVSNNGRFGVRLAEVIAQGDLLSGIERRV
jgi:flagellar motor switch protein FliN